MKKETRWLSDRQVAERYSVGRATVWRWAQAGNIPAPKRIGENTTRWSAPELDAHDARRFQSEAA